MIRRRKNVQKKASFNHPFSYRQYSICLFTGTIRYNGTSSCPHCRDAKRQDIYGGRECVTSCSVAVYQ